MVLGLSTNAMLWLETNFVAGNKLRSKAKMGWGHGFRDSNFQEGVYT